MNFARDLFLTREWLEATIFLAISLIAIALLKRFLSRMKMRAQRAFVGELIPYILNLGYIIALSGFLHTAPLNPHIETWSGHITYILTVWIFLILLRRTLLVVAEWSIGRAGAASALQNGFFPLIKNIATLFVFITGGIMVLKHFGYDVMSLLTALGVGSLAVGLAAKEALSNMISGFVLIMDRNLRPGDRVNLGGSVGDIEEIGLRSTRMRTGDGNTLIVPNFDLANSRFLNLSDPTRESSCSIQIRVPYSADFTRVKAVCLKIIAGIPKVNHSKDPWVNLASLSDGFQLLGVGFWLREMDDSGSVLTDFNQQLLIALRSENISLIELPSTPMQQTPA